MNIKVDFDLDWEACEETIEQAIKDEIISQVKAEARRAAKEMRSVIAGRMELRQEALIDVAMRAVDEAAAK